LKLDALDLYSRIAQGGAGSIANGQRIEGALEDLREKLIEVAAQRSTLHGWQSQALFEAIVVGLGSVQLLKLEDTGDVYFSGPDLKPPDFRVITSDGEQILVEAKNFYGSNARSDFRIRQRDLDGLRRYTELVSVDALKIAVYWARWNLWTLFDARLFKPCGGQYLSVSLPKALKANEMGSIGDRIPATEWPIGVTMFSDPNEDRFVDEQGKAEFTIGKIEFSVAGRIVNRSSEKAILLRLMQFGGWGEQTDSKIEDGQLISASFLFSPQEPPPSSQEFAMHNSLSSIFSAMFAQATVGEEAEITELRINADPSALARLIPDDYEGEVLRIWRFQLTPS